MFARTNEQEKGLTKTKKEESARPTLLKLIDSSAKSISPRFHAIDSRDGPRQMLMIYRPRYIL